MPRKLRKPSTVSSGQCLLEKEFRALKTISIEGLDSSDEECS